MCQRKEIQNVRSKIKIETAWQKLHRGEYWFKHGLVGRHALSMDVLKWERFSTEDRRRALRLRNGFISCEINKKQQQKTK